MLYREPINSVSDKEREAVLTLTKYFNDFWTIVDVGSNKGNWTDILLQEREPSNQHENIKVYFFEPNELLLNYTRVKYEHTNKIEYFPYALGSENTRANFYYFEDNHSGISNLMGNWKELQPFEKDIKVVRLDWFLHDKEFDIIKIDVEGYELEVLKGAENLLKNKKIKFIQVECSPHNKDVKFQDIVQYLGQFGYKCWDYTNEEFIEINTFPENTIDNFYFSYLPIGKYHYTQLWNEQFIKNTQFLKKKVEFACEIGAAEGLTSNYICDELLAEGSRLIVIDPFEDRYTEWADETTNNIFVGQYERFVRNTIHKPIEIVRKKSEDAYLELSNYLFTFVFVDGDHSPEIVFKDGEFAFKQLKLGGYILFDDYNWKFENKETKIGIDKFLEKYKDYIEVLIKDEQVMVQKIKHI